MINRNVTEKCKKDQEQYYRFWVWVVLVVILLSATAIRARLLNVPLERDEGEYAYAGQLILQGITPYSLVYNMKMPGIYAAYALILAVFGQTHSGIHLGLLFINMATIFLMFLLGKKLYGQMAGIVAAACFALLSLGQSVQGVFANAEHFVILPALGGILFLIRAVDYQKWLSLLAGAFLLGLAFLMKQHGGAFIIFGGLYLFFSELHRQSFVWKIFIAKGILFLVGVLLPFAVACLILWRCGVFERFWFWTFVYVREYVSSVPLLVGLKKLGMQITRIASSAIMIWILAGIGLICLCRSKKARQDGVFVVGFLYILLLAVCPGFHFRPHYFILLLPVVALLAGIGASSIQNLFARSRTPQVIRAVPILLSLAVLFHAAYQQRKFLFVVSPTMATRMTYEYNPFPESLEIARYIKENSTKDDRIAVIGSEPQIYFYSGRRSATGYIYTYALMEKHSYALKMQEEMIQEIESARPKFLVYVNIPTSWLVRRGSEKMIFEWFRQYQQEYYRQVGVINIISPERTIYHWEEKVPEHSPLSKYWILVLGRKNYEHFKPHGADEHDSEFLF